MSRPTALDDESTDRILRLLRSPVTVGVARPAVVGSGASNSGASSSGASGSAAGSSGASGSSAALGAAAAGGSEVPAPRQLAGFVPPPPPGYATRRVLPALEGLGEESAAPPAPRRGGRHRSPAPRVVTIPAVLRGGPRDVRTSAVLALLALGVLAGVVFAARVVWAARASEPTPVAARPGLVARSVPSGFQTSLPTPGAMSGDTGSVPGASGTVGVSGPIVRVHVVGEVADPGVVDVPAGARVIDAITKAGGSLPSADLKRINLARAVSDGEQIHVPAPGEEILAGSAGTTLGPVGSGVGLGGGPGASGRINLNKADLAALDGLPGVGPVLAQRIIDWRTEHGRFTSVDELGEVSGIGEKLLAVLGPKVTV